MKVTSQFFTAMIKKTLLSDIARNPALELFWEGYTDEQNTLEDVKLIEDMDNIINGGSFANIILYKSKTGTLKKTKRIQELAEYLYHSESIDMMIIDKKVENTLSLNISDKKEEITPLDGSQLREIFLSDHIKTKFPLFEIRKPQMHMIKTIINAFNDNQSAFIEAGTGTGKSLAYLIPSMLFAYQNHTKIVISTFTKNLQHQLLEKDLPLMKEILNLPVSYTMIKGKGNYLCLKRFHELENLTSQNPQLYEEDQEYQERKEKITALQNWLKKTKTGDLEELPLSTTKVLWNDVNTSSDLCSHQKCPFFLECFYYKMKQEYQQSHIIIVNHSLLISQLELDFHDIPHQIIPSFSHLIIDEAHNFTKSALIEEKTSYFAFLYKINSLYSKGQGKKGVINTLLYFFSHNHIHGTQDQIKDMINEELLPSIEGLKEKAAIFFNSLHHIIEPLMGDRNAIFRITEEQHYLFQDLKPSYDLLKDHVKTLEALLQILAGKFTLFPETFKDDFQTQLKILSQIPKQIQMDFYLWDFLLSPPNKNVALWLEKQNHVDNISLHYVNLDNQEFLKKTLYEAKNSLIFTSATLSINKSLSSFKNSIAFDQENTSSILPPVFNYQENCQLLIPEDIPQPFGKDSAESPFIKAILPLIYDSIKIVGGGTLILCTSFYLLEIIQNYLKDTAKGFEIFSQGSDTHSNLIEQFKASKKGVLLGVDSFWEGVDIPGEDLRMVIIPKLPFRPPNHPIAQTQHELAEEEGVNSFMTLSVPEATIRLKQGFGRLIRTSYDRGSVLCLDSRIMKKFYGKIMLESLPVKPIYKKKSLLLEDLKTFFNKQT